MKDESLLVLSINPSSLILHLSSLIHSHPSSITKYLTHA